MKKVTMLILLVIVASTMLMALSPTKMVRLYIINKSDYDVYMKLEGSGVTNAFYYLTVPAGSRGTPTVKVFTIFSDVYTRTTWQCDGIKSSGTLIVDGNIRLTFLPCGEFSCVTGLTIWFFPDRCGGGAFYWNYRYLQGEPRMEKISYFKYLLYGKPSWSSAQNYNGFWNVGCFTWYWRLKTYQLPKGCLFRYQY
jgi:hypothetical protein